MALGSTQPLTEMSTRNLLRDKGRPARKVDVTARFYGFYTYITHHATYIICYLILFYVSVVSETIFRYYTSIVRELVHCSIQRTDVVRKSFKFL
jgi:hypothetical protein